MIEAIVAILVVLLAGGAFLAWRHRSERGIESGISSFRRELSALAPRREPRVATRAEPTAGDRRSGPEESADGPDAEAEDQDPDDPDPGATGGDAGAPGEADR